MMPATFAERLTVSSTAEGYQIRQEIVSGKSCRFRLLYFWDFDAALALLPSGFVRDRLLMPAERLISFGRRVYGQAMPDPPNAPLQRKKNRRTSYLDLRCQAKLFHLLVTRIFQS
jgi:hypothetical protein